MLWLASCFTLLATPDWADNTNETYIGSNEKSYATFLTETNNQGSYYEWREVKKFNQYSKTDGTIIDTSIVSDIIYSIDANHNNPNTQPKITMSVQMQNRELNLSEITTEYHLPLQPANKPDWIKRLSWMDGNIIMDDKLILVNKEILTGLKIPVDTLSEISIEDIIVQIYTDPDSLYLQISIETDTDDNTYILHLSQEITKQLRNRINLLDEYIFIKSFESLEKANAFGLGLIKNSQAKHFYGLNPEIWLSNVDVGNTTPYLLLHRPLELPINPDQIKRLDTVIGINTLLIKSDNFIEKWIPYAPNSEAIESPDSPADSDEPDELIEKPIK